MIVFDRTFKFCILLSCTQTNAMELMEKVAKAIQQVNDNLNFNEVIQHEESILMLFRETMLKIYDFGFEVCGF